VSRSLIKGRPTVYAQSALLIAGGVLLAISLTYGALPFAFAVPVFAIGVAWRALTLGRAPTVPRKLGGAASALLLLSGSLIAVRIVIGHAWLPSSFDSALSFISAELFLIPVAVVLLVVSLVWHLVVRTRPTAPPSYRSDTAAANAATALIVLAALLLVGSQVSPRILRPLSRHLEWGQYGFGPPVTLTSLAMLTTDAGITFPEDAMLLDGEFLGGPCQRYVIAKVRISHDSVETFLKHQPRPFSWTTRARGRAAVEEFRAIRYGAPPLMKQRGWRPDLARHAIFADGYAGPGREAECWVLIDLDASQTAVLYTAWSPT
jgi:type IV secretory pathway TrbD component